MSFPANRPKPRLVVATLTYQRPAGLAALLPSLVLQADRVRDEAAAVRILVVDNDPEASAKNAVLLAGSSLPTDGSITIDYVHEPTPGIAQARNRCLIDAGDADLLVFIDDDELPGQEWLFTLLKCWKQFGSQAVAGPVERVFEADPADWIRSSSVFRSRHFPSGTIRPAAACGNLLLDMRMVRDARLSFDARLGLIGGEDSLFTRQLVAAGGEIRWCEEAVVSEFVPVERQTRVWIQRRRIRSGSVGVLVALESANSRWERTRIRADSFSRGSAAIVLGYGSWVRGKMRGSPRQMAGASARTYGGIGRIRGAFGRSLLEYGRREE